MKIVHLIFSLEIGGAETMLIDIINEQVKENDIHLIIINDLINIQLLQLIDERVKVFLIKRKPKTLPIFTYFKLNIYIKKEKISIIHCHNQNIIPLILPFFHSKTCLTIHDTGVSTKYFNQYALLIAISDAVKMDVINRVKKAIICEVVYNGIDFDKIRKKNIVNNVDKLKIVQVGRLIHNKKGQDLLLWAVSELNFDIEITFIGEGESFEYLRRLANDLMITNKVIFLGERTRNYIYERLKNYDLLVQPSLYEGFGLTVIEGIAAKLPVLVADIEGPMEIIEKGKYGLYFKSGDSGSLKMKILEFIEKYQAKDIQKQVNAAYINAKSKYTIQNTASIYLKLYNEKIIK